MYLFFQVIQQRISERKEQAQSDANINKKSEEGMNSIITLVLHMSSVHIERKLHVLYVFKF